MTSLVILLALVLFVRLYQVQIANGEEYRGLAERQYVHTTQNLFDRGSIYFSTKDGETVSAASIRSGFLIASNPSLIKDEEKTYEDLNVLYPLDKVEFTKHVSNKADTYEVLATKINEKTALAIKDKKIPGVSVYRDQWRYYPGDTLAAHSIGFIGYDGDTLAGRYGLERYYEDTLERNDETVSVNFFAEIFSNLGLFTYDAKQQRSGDLVTSLEPTVTRTLDSELQKIHEKLQSKVTGGIIMDPKTGEIYALSVTPGFDLNDRGDASLQDFRNPLVEDVYEMGSIIKPLTIAAGIDTKTITAQTTYYDAGFLELDGYKIQNFDHKGRGTVPMQEVLNQSLNTGVATIVKMMGRTKYRDYLRKFEFGTETGIDLPSEAHGLVDNVLDSPRDVEYATASFGQGIAMTPIETIRALATLANGGMLVTPHVATEIRLSDGSINKVTYPDDKRVFTPETSEEISRMLTVVVDKALRGGTKKFEHYSVAAKTGTAQIKDPNGKGYYEDRYLHSFFGYFPSYNPRFIIFLYTVEPKGVQYASETLTDPFINMVKFLTNYYAIPPDR